MMYAEIGAFDAKAKLSKLLQEVMRGQHFTITVRGKAVADLVPSKNASHYNVQEAVAAIQTIKKVKGVSGEMLSQWIQEGRQ
jgi:prevent-host-death family protein